MLDSAWRSHRLVTAEHHERREPVLVGALRVRKTILERVLRREKRDNALARNVAAEVRDEMPEIVFLRHPDGAIGQKDIGTVLREPSNRVVGVDPGIHPLVRLELGARRPQFGGHHGPTATESSQKIRIGHVRN
jgi:hypothetical protein